MGERAVEVVSLAGELGLLSRRDKEVGTSLNYSIIYMPLYIPIAACAQTMFGCVWSHSGLRDLMTA
jgi:hypothetical protein